MDNLTIISLQCISVNMFTNIDEVLIRCAWCKNQISEKFLKLEHNTQTPFLCDNKKIWKITFNVFKIL